MKMKYINRVRKNISIYASKKATSILDGTYLSIFKGRTQNFEDLRLYIPGDNVKDIDWKSSARSQSILVRRYIAEKKHQIFIVMDTGKKMLADTEQGECKKDIALLSAATIACIANRNGDYVSLAYRQGNQLAFFQKKSNLYEIDAMLSHYEADMSRTEEKQTSFEQTLEFLSKKIKEHAVIFLITDLLGMNEISPETLKKLTCRNDVLCIQIPDAKMFGGQAYDMEEEMEIPQVFRKNRKLLRYEEEHRKSLERASQQKLLQNRVVCTQISNEKEIVNRIIDLLGRHKNANRS